MTPQLPTSQLLDRNRALLERLTQHHWWAIAPPRDPWLGQMASGAVCADVSVAEGFDAHRRPVVMPYSGRPPDSRAVPVLFWPKAHRLGIWWLRWIGRQWPADTPLLILGEHQGGVKRVPAMLETLGMKASRCDVARRCSLFSTGVQDLAGLDSDDWITFTSDGLELHSHPGVFGHGKRDEGTMLLLERLAESLPATPARVLDMGCGDGIISAWLARRGHQVTSVDVNAFAVEACRRTLAANHLEGTVMASDVYSALQGTRFDVIVSNPPFHDERDISYGPASRLITQAPSHLTRGGRLVLVANAFLPYLEPLDATFGSVKVLADNRRFRVYQAGGNQSR